jgi:hypothetical protein
VRRGERTEITDYIAPPYILSKETYPGLNEFAWSQGEYVSSRVIGEAFGIKDLPAAQGIYLNQPNPSDVRWKEIRPLFFAVLFILVGLEIYFDRQRPLGTLAEAQFTFERSPSAIRPANLSLADAIAPMSEAAKTFTTAHFSLAGGEQRVVIQADAEVDNNWLDLDLNLVNASTNASYPTGMELSYYHGSDEDGQWSEGARTASVSLPAVPAGEYYLTVEPGADPQLQRLPFSVRVQAGGLFESNLIVMLGLVLFYPGMLLWRRHTFERERWEDADGHPWERSGS